MIINGWKYYKHAAIPTTAPHVEVNVLPLQDETIFKLKKGVLFARWTSDWDCGYETKWWYVIKDTPFDISSLKSKRRYEINKGIKNFDVREIDCRKYKQEIYEVQIAAMAGYPEKYRCDINKDKLFARIDEWDYYKSYGAFLRETGELSGYSLLRRDGDYINFALQYAKPENEKLAVNAALVNYILYDHQEFLNRGGYICDGSKSVIHETAFQDYLEKYFDFRKAYCHLHIKYKKPFGLIIRLLAPFKSLLKKSESVFISQLYALLEMEEATKDE